MTTRIDAQITALTAKVETGEVHWGAIASILRNRIMRLDEILRPLPGYAPACGETAFLMERAERVAQLAALKAKHQPAA